MVTAADYVSVAAEAMRTILSDSAKFRTWTGTANPTAAKARIHIGGLDAEDIVRPYALILNVAPESFSVGGGTRHYAVPAGTISVAFEMAIAADVTWENATFALDNAIGGIIGDLVALSGDRDGHIDIRLEGEEEDERADRKEDADTFSKILVWRFGPE